MKKILSVILAVTLTALSLISCTPTVAEEGDVTVVVECADGSFEVYKTYLQNVKNKDEGALGILEHLRDREENPLALTCEDGAYGAFITSIGSIKQDAASGEYITVYTTTLADSYEDAPTITFEGALLYSSGVGVSFMSVPVGTVILFRLEKF